MLYGELHHYKNDKHLLCNSNMSYSNVIEINFNELVGLDHDVPNVKHIIKYG